MSQQEQQEKKNRRIGVLTSLGVHAALLLLFIFAMAWRAPDPPLPEFGIIVNLGFDDQGSGDVQTDEPATEPVTEDQPVEETEPQQTEPEPVVEDKPVDKVEKQEVITSKIESPVTVKKEEEKVKEEPKPKEPEKIKTEYKPDAQAAQKTNENKGEKTESEGDDVNKTGNKGEPEGKLDPNGQYTGKPGGGGGGDGMSLSMSGWAWSEKPRTSGISNNESGRIVFEIICDKDGLITGIKTLERGVTAATEQLLRSELMRISLERTEGGHIPERSTGTVTFVVKSK